MASRYLFPFDPQRGLWGRGDPLLELNREMNRLFEEASRGGGGEPARGSSSLWAPRVDIHDTGEAIEISAELPGVSEEDVDVRLEGEMLSISGEKRNERRDEQAHVTERSYGSFHRSIQLPFLPDPDQVQASFRSGVLTIVVPKKGQPEKARQIKIGGGEARSARSENLQGQASGRSETGTDNERP